MATTTLLLTASPGETFPIGFDFTGKINRDLDPPERLVTETDPNQGLSPVVLREVLNRSVDGVDPFFTDNPAVRSDGTTIDMQLRLPPAIQAGDRLRITVFVKTNKMNRHSTAAEILVV